MLRTAAVRASSTLSLGRRQVVDVSRILHARAYSSGSHGGERAVPSWDWSTLRTGLAAAAILGAVATPTSYAWFERKKESTVAGAPDKALGPLVFKDVEVVVYQYETCPFCNKVKAFLDYHKIPYKVVEVNPLYKGEMSWSPNYKKVPVVTVNGQQLVESSRIIDELEEIMLEKAPSLKIKVAKPSKQEEEEERRWRLWVDGYYVHLLSPNIYRTLGESFQAFEYMSTTGNFGWFQRESARYVGAILMYAIGWNIARKLGLEDRRAALYAAADEFVSAVGPARPFLGGSKPNKGDLAVYGVTRAVEGLDTFKDLMEKSRLGPWYQRMRAAVGETSRLPGPPTGPEPVPAKALLVRTPEDAVRPQ